MRMETGSVIRVCSALAALLLVLAKLFTRLVRTQDSGEYVRLMLAWRPSLANVEWEPNVSRGVELCVLHDGAQTLQEKYYTMLFEGWAWLPLAVVMAGLAVAVAVAVSVRLRSSRPR